MVPVPQVAASTVDGAAGRHRQRHRTAGGPALRLVVLATPRRRLSDKATMPFLSPAKLLIILVVAVIVSGSRRAAQGCPSGWKPLEGSPKGRGRNSNPRSVPTSRACRQRRSSLGLLDRLSPFWTAWETCQGRRTLFPSHPPSVPIWTGTTILIRIIISARRRRRRCGQQRQNWELHIRAGWLTSPAMRTGRFKATPG